MSRARCSVANNNEFLIWWLDLLPPSLELQSIITAHNQWLSETRCIPFWTKSVFCSPVTDLVLIYESVTSSASVVRWLALNSWTLLRLNDWTLVNWNELNWTLSSLQDKVKVKVTLRLTVSQSVSLGVEPLLFDSYGLVFVGRPLWQEDGSVFCISCWPSPAQSFSGPSPVVLATIFYCLTFETSLFVASYDSQGHGGGIRSRIHTGISSLTNELFCYNFEANRRECITSNCSSLIICFTRCYETCVNLVGTLWFIQAYSLLRNALLESSCEAMDYFVTIYIYIYTELGHEIA
jgi:hypothetical protein